MLVTKLKKTEDVAGFVEDLLTHTTQISILVSEGECEVSYILSDEES